MLLGLLSGDLQFSQGEAAESRDSTRSQPSLLCFTNFTSWSVDSRPGEGKVLVSPLISTTHSWAEMIVSWNVQPAEGAGLEVEAQAVSEATTTEFYSLGHWSLDGGAPVVRSSQGRQKDREGEVKTDTLVLRRPASGFRLRLGLRGELAQAPERLRLVAVSLSSPGTPIPDRPAAKEVWGRTLDVPERSQVAYAEGRAWCSPTAVSMLMAWWAKQQGRPEWDRDVPIVAKAVQDPGWGGTGNWPFNTAYAGSFPNMIGCAARLRDLRDLEDLILAGIPVALSVSAPVLHGHAPRPESGHLILCVGFTPEGDVVANDPWARFEAGQKVRRIYPRADVAMAWATSQRLAYLIAPSSLARAFPAEWR